MGLSSIAGNPVSSGSIEPPRAARALAAFSAGPQMPATPDPEPIAQALAAINRALPAASRSLEFSVDSETRRRVVKVVDGETKQVIRQIPSAQALELARSIDRMRGLLVQQEA
jgi:flagellar protein FlaG